MMKIEKGDQKLRDTQNYALTELANDNYLVKHQENDNAQALYQDANRGSFTFNGKKFNTRTGIANRAEADLKPFLNTQFGPGAANTILRVHAQSPALIVMNTLTPL